MSETTETTNKPDKIATKELVSSLAKNTDLNQKQVKNILDELISTIKENVANGSEVELWGLGTFGHSNKKERKGKNPKTKEVITIPAHKSPTFKAAKQFKDLLK